MAVRCEGGLWQVIFRGKTLPGLFESEADAWLHLLQHARTDRGPGHD